MNPIIYRDVERGITYTALNSHHFEKTARMIAMAFLNEPLTKALSIGFEEILSVTEKICDFTLRQNLSIVALDGAGLVVGAVISYNCESQFSLMDVSDKFIPLFALLEDIEKGSVFDGPVLCQFMLGVNPAFGGRKIGSNLIRLNNRIASEKGFMTAKASATGPISQHIFLGQGYEIVKKIVYKNFSFRGKKKFQGVGECKSCVLVSKRLK